MERFIALRDFIENIRKKNQQHLLVVVDITSDCVEDFNRTGQSLELIDLMNSFINSYNTTFLCIIHENPQSEKARGHLGTELLNKATNAIQISFFDKEGVLKIHSKKCRNTKQLPDLFCRYSEEEKTLVLLDEKELNQSKLKLQQNSNQPFFQEVANLLSKGSLLQGELIPALTSILQVSERTIEEKLKKAVAEKWKFPAKGESKILKKEKKGRKVLWSLTELGKT